jgi:hypothetical protein
MVKRASLLVASALTLGSAACAAVLGFERLAEGDAGVDGGVDGGSGDAPVGPTVPSCTEGVAPNQPTIVPGAAIVDGGWDGKPLYVAANYIDLGIDGGRPGINLDETCTTSRETGSCVFRGADDDFRRLGVDVDGGVDNVTGRLLPELGPVFVALKPSEVNQRLQDARFGLVIELADWNGTSDDDVVVVTLFPALGVWQDGGPPGAPPNVPPFPGFSRTDDWMRDDRFVQSTLPRLTSRVAYVSGGKVTARFDPLVVPIRVPYDLKLFDVLLRDAYVVATIGMTADGPALRGGVIAGRWRVQDMLTQVQQMYINQLNELSKTYVCTPEAKNFYLAIWRQACDVLDIADNASRDRMNEPCSALSVGIGFETYAVDRAGKPYNQDDRYSAAGQLKPNERCGGKAAGDTCPYQP